MLFFQIERSGPPDGGLARVSPDPVPELSEQPEACVRQARIQFFLFWVKTRESFVSPVIAHFTKADHALCGLPTRRLRGSRTAP